ncbi:hypothetical protein [Oceanobacillus jeddahense]|uniref:Uncharacterized protein n=1 Tax=Oceanobacillus jeddahense TaxID=1462527 RepID=A0ABY5JRS0_9BACI|nr:hypothetical protein [Oceanobacillus jeddahense]UUI02485.1 hypothetical protein NP439_20980 [Oceanobacillus jeddahense]
MADSQRFQKLGSISNVTWDTDPETVREYNNIPRIRRESWNRMGRVFVTETIDEAIVSVTNDLAAEHLDKYT